MNHFSYQEIHKLKLIRFIKLILLKLIHKKLLVGKIPLHYQVLTKYTDKGLLC